MHHFDISDDPFFWTSEKSQVQPQNNILKIFNNRYLHGTFKNGQNSISEYHFETFENSFRHNFEMFEDPLFHSDF